MGQNVPGTKLPGKEVGQNVPGNCPNNKKEVKKYANR